MIGAKPAPNQRRSSAIARSLEFDDIAFRVRDVDRWTFTFRAVTRFRRARRDSMCRKMAADCRRVERFDAKAEMIEVAAFLAGRGTPCPAEFAVDRHQVQQRPARPQLNQPYEILAPLDRASKHVAVEAKHRLQAAHAP